MLNWKCLAEKRSLLKQDQDILQILNLLKSYVNTDLFSNKSFIFRQVHDFYIPEIHRLAFALQAYKAGF